MQDMKQNEDKGNNPCPALGSVSEIARVAVVAQVGLTRLDDPNPKNSVKQYGKKNETPFHQRENDAQRVDRINRFLKRGDSIEQACIGEQVHNHVGPHRNKSAEGMKSPYQEFILAEETGRVAGNFSHGTGRFHHRGGASAEDFDYVEEPESLAEDN
jgi:hypothetical protein